jgi:hypothetical protein
VTGAIEWGLLVPAVLQYEGDIIDQLLGVLVIILQIDGIDGCKQAGILSPFQESGILFKGSQHKLQASGIGFPVKQG